MSNRYFIYHCHSTYSKNDSTAKPEEYIEKLKELKHTAICFSEHGNVSNHIKKKQLADKAGLKYVHAVEMYLTKTLDEKIRDNYHVILIAKNKDGVKELNELITLSNTDTHLYYNNRLTFEEYFNISENIIKISACLGGVLNKLEPSTPLFNKFVDSFDFLEIQYHNLEEQKLYNQMLSKLNKPLIAGTDTHEINDYGSECRKILMLNKGQSYGDEDSFDLTLKSYDELISAFKRQASLPEEKILEAIDNTIILEDMIEDYSLDYSFKYPTSYINENEMLKDKTFESLISFNIKDDIIDLYIDRINEELLSFSKVGMSGFMLYMSEIGDHCRDNFIPYGYGRGSVTGSLVAYLLKITDVDPIIWGTNFARFVNDSRISLGDIDTDYSPEDRIKVFNYIRQRSTDSNAAHIGTFGKLSTKSIIDSVGRALNKNLDDVSAIKKGYEIIEVKEKRLDRVFENGGILEDEYLIEKDLIKNETDAYISKFEDIFHYYKGLNGVIVSEGKHACGMIGSPVNIREEIGLRYDNKSNSWISCCDMKNIDSVNFVKFDILSLKTLQIIKHTYKLLGKEIPRSHEIDWNDINVYDSITDTNIGLFQMESQSSFSHMKKFAPKSLKEISLVNAFVRPSCDSFREKIIAREFNKTPSTIIDEILKESYGYLVYQEQIISFLQQACGFTGQEADTVRRYIGKKDLVALEMYLPKIKEGYIKVSGKERSIAETECEEFMKVLKDAGFYSFSYNHSLAYSMFTFMTAYLRYYHPVEFITSYLNNASDEDDIKAGTELAKLKGIEICNPKFGLSESDYSIKNGKIYKGLKSILHISDVCSNKLNEIYNTIPNKDIPFPEIIENLKCKEINSKQMKILIKLNLFSDYGKAKKLHEWYVRYDIYNKRKTISKTDIPKGTESIIKYAIKNNVDGFSETVAQYKIDHFYLLNQIFEKMKDIDFTTEENIIHQLSYLGYIQDEELLGLYIGTVMTNKTKNDSFAIKLINGSQIWVKFSSTCNEPSKGDLIYINNMYDVKNGRFTNKTILSYSKLELDKIKRA